MLILAHSLSLASCYYFNLYCFVLKRFLSFLLPFCLLLICLFTCVVGHDLDSFSTLVVFGTGETNRTVQISTTDDLLLEYSEVFQVSLSRLDVGVVVGEPSQAVVTIMDPGKLENPYMNNAYLY